MLKDAAAKDGSYRQVTKTEIQILGVFDEERP